MQRTLFAFLLIAIFLTGCSSTPVTSKDVLPQAATFTPAPTDRPTDALTQTATLPPAPVSQPIDILQQAATFNPSISGSLTLKRQTLARIMLDDTYIYWATDGHDDTIFRAPLNGGLPKSLPLQSLKAAGLP